MRKTFIFFLITAFTVALVTPVFAAKKTATAAKAATSAQEGLGSYHAILIGINDYESFNRLKTPVKDVEALADVLKKEYGFEDVILLTDKTEDKPTASNILKTIREKAQRLTAKDNLLIYYGGHGHLDELTSAGYWIPINGKTNDPATWISHDQIKSLLETNKISVKNFALVADSCYSGGMRSIEIYKDTRGRLNDEDKIRQDLLDKGSKRSREVITSGGLEPVEDVVAGSDHSLFAHYFIKALNENKNRYQGMGMLLHEVVKPELAKWGKQTPEVSRVRTAVDENGLFILTKMGIADRPKKKDSDEEVARLKKENEELQAELVKQKEKQKKYEAELSSLTTKQNQLLNEKTKLDEMDKKNKADEKKLKESLAQKDKMSAEKVAEVEKEKQRIDGLKSKIDQERKSLTAKEKSVAETEALLQKTKAELNAKNEQQKLTSEMLEKRLKQLEEKEKAITIAAQKEEERAKQASRKAKEEENRAKEAARKAKEEEDRAKEAALKAKEEERRALEAVQKAKAETDRAEASKQLARKGEEQARLAAIKQKEAEEAAEAARQLAKKGEEQAKQAALQQKKSEEAAAAAKKIVEELEAKTRIAAGIISDYEKGGADAKGRFIVMNNVVFDKETNLMWLRDANKAHSGKAYDEAEKYVNNISLGGYNDWRIPTSEEWRSLIPKEAKGINKAFPDGHPFKNVVIVGNYWVASSITGSSGINLGNGSVSRYNKKNPGYLWPVRYASPDEIMKIKSEEQRSKYND